MCERYALPEQLTAEREFMPVWAWWQFVTRFNVAPHQYVPAVRLHEGQSEAVMMRWGLIPRSIEESPRPGPSPHCIDSDALERCASHRQPWLEGRRCILPVAGYYTWQLTAAKYRQPWFAHPRDRAVFGIAAVWDRFESKDEDVVESCSIIRVPANDLMLEIANTDPRMPAILRRRDYDIWLRGTPEAALAVLQPYKCEWMQAHPVSPRINSPEADDPDLVRPAA